MEDQKNNDNYWPISPTFLRRIKDDEKSRADLNHNGVFSKGSVQGFIAVLSQDVYINNPATVFEFIPKGLNGKFISDDNQKFKTEPEEIGICGFNDFFIGKTNCGSILRTDSNSFHGTNGICDFFREVILENCPGVENEKCENDCMLECNIKHIKPKEKTVCKKKCHHECNKQDNLVLFNALMGTTKSTYKKTITKIIDEFNLTHKGFNIELKESEFNNNEEENEKYPYFRYTCPFTGLMELCFPIFLEDTVIACLIVGGVIDKDTDKTLMKWLIKHKENWSIENIDEIVINDNDPIFNGILKYFKILQNKVNNKENGYQHIKKTELNNNEEEGLKKIIREHYIKILNNRIEILNKDGDIVFYDKMIEKIVQHIGIFEKRILQRVQVYRYQYVVDNFKTLKNELNENIFNPENTKNTDGKSKLEERLKLSNVNREIFKVFGKAGTLFPNDKGFTIPNDKGFTILYGLKNYNAQYGKFYPIAYFGAKKPKEINYYFDLKDFDKNELPRSRAARYQKKYNNGVCIANLLFDFTP